MALSWLITEKRLLQHLSQHDLYCLTHQDRMKVCCINGCDDVAEPGYRTCTKSAHRAFQSAAGQKNTAVFQLCSQLRHTGISQAPTAGLSLGPDAVTLSSSPEPSSVPHEASSEDLLSSQPADVPCLTGRLYRNWTHNE